jgi:hypothetical protein
MAFARQYFQMATNCIRMAELLEGNGSVPESILSAHAMETVVETK